MNNEEKDLHGYEVRLTNGPTYEDGFADGYSRAWQECWEYMRELIENSKKQDTKGGEG